MAFAHVSRTIRNVTGKTFARKFITLGKVITYWPDAVGPELAAKSYPVGMSVRKNVKKGKNDRDLVATLEVAASSADATLLHYQKNLILERLNLLIGAGMIVDIKVIHNTPKTTDFTTKWVPKPSGGAPKTNPFPCTNQVHDDELRLALERLGQYIDASDSTETPLTN